jgi:hypothetical protein
MVKNNMADGRRVTLKRGKECAIKSGKGQKTVLGKTVDWNSSCPSALFILADLCWGGSWAK